MKIESFNVLPNLPESLSALDELSTNMWFTWNWDAIMMFVQMDEDLWHRSHRNPKWISSHKNWRWIFRGYAGGSVPRTRTAL